MEEKVAILRGLHIGIGYGRTAIGSDSQLPKVAGVPTASDPPTPREAFATATSTVTKWKSGQKNHFIGKVLIESIKRHMTDFHDQQAASNPADLV